MLVRPARREDAEGIADVHVLTWRAAYAHIFGAERVAEIGDGRRAQWEERLANPLTPACPAFNRCPLHGREGDITSRCRALIRSQPFPPRLAERVTGNRPGGRGIH